MSAYPFKYLFFALILLSTIVEKNSGQYVPSTPTVQPLYPRGLRLSLPHEKGISTVRYNIKINEVFKGLQSGHITRDIVNMINGQWTYEDRSTILRKGDVIYFWMRITYNGNHYSLLQEQFVVDEFYNYDGSPARTNVPVLNTRLHLNAPILNRFASNSPTSERLIYQPNSNGRETVSNRFISNSASLDSSSVSHRPILTAPPSDSSSVVSASISERPILAAPPSDSASELGTSILTIPASNSPGSDFSFGLGSSTLTRPSNSPGSDSASVLGSSTWSRPSDSPGSDLSFGLGSSTLTRPSNSPGSDLSFGLGSSTLTRPSNSDDFNAPPDVSASISERPILAGPPSDSASELGSSTLTRPSNSDDFNAPPDVSESISTVPAANLPDSNEPNSNTPDNAECTPSETKVYDTDLKPVKVCAGQLIFEDNFYFLNKYQWKLLQQFPRAPAYEFVLYMNSDEIVYVRNGILNIQPIMTDDKYGPGFVRSGSLVLDPCTLKPGTSDCKRTAVGSYIIPPIISGRLDTSLTFRFSYGRIEVRAKLPHGDWLYPKINLQAVNATVTNFTYFHTFIIAHSNGNPELRKVNRHDISGHILVAGRFTTHRHEYQVFSNEDELPSKYSDRLWSSDFHVYEVEWRRGMLIAKVDGEQFGQQKIQESDDVPVYINLGIAAGGRLPFPDNSTSGSYMKPWKSMGSKALFDFYSAQDQWIESWKQGENKLQVDYVKVWAL